MKLAKSSDRRPHRYSLVDSMPSVMRQGARDTCAAAAAVVLAEYRFGAGTRLSVQYLFAETANREHEWIARNLSALRAGEAPDEAFKAAFPTQLAELELVREAAGAGSDEEKSLLEVFESCQNKRLKGQSLKRCLETLAVSGVCRNSLWPYDPNAVDRACSALPDGTRDDARRRRIARQSVYILDSPGNVDEVKGLLSGQNGRLPAPVAVTLSAKDQKRDPLGHALVVVGYEDDRMNPGEGWFLLQNSWGTEWGDGGYGKISYGEFSRRCVEAGALVMPRRGRLLVTLSAVAGLLLAAGVAAFATLCDGRSDAELRWWTDAPWTNGTLTVCADISKGASYTHPWQLRELFSGASTNAVRMAFGRCLFGVETLDLSSTQVLLLFTHMPVGNYSDEQRRVIRTFLETGGTVVAFLCDCNFGCMGELLAPYGLRLHRRTGKEPLAWGARPTQRFDIEGAALVSAEALDGDWTTLVRTEGPRPCPVMGCRRVGKGLLAYASQRMVGRVFNRCLNVDFWQAFLSAAAQAGGKVSEGPVADQSADAAPVRIRKAGVLVCASEPLRRQAELWASRLAEKRRTGQLAPSVFERFADGSRTNEVRMVLCDSTDQDSELEGRRRFWLFGAFRRDFHRQAR